MKKLFSISALVDCSMKRIRSAGFETQSALTPSARVQNFLGKVFKGVSENVHSSSTARKNRRGYQP